MVKSLRPTLLNKGTKSECRGSFTDAKYTKIYTALLIFDKETANTNAAATRETLRNYVLFLANTGVRHGTEALVLRWQVVSDEFELVSTRPASLSFMPHKDHATM